MKLAARLFGKVVVFALATSACGSSDQDLFPTDLPEAGPGADASVDGSEDAATDAPSDSGVTCETADDCPAPAGPCELSICVRGLCSTAFAPAGTIIDESDQVPGDCQRLECGEAGALAMKADPDDVPLDDGNVCTEKRCEGFQPTVLPVEEGTPCGDDGVCNGKGECGECVPGTQSCDGKVPRTCDAEGRWDLGEPCPFVCEGEGRCGGVCVPGAESCQGQQPRICNESGQWEANGASCPNVCFEGACSGVCPPGAARCSGKVPQTCDELGQWRDGVECPFTCSAGSCTGQCAPGSQRCNGNVPQTCNASSMWESGTACTDACVDGACTDLCSPGTKRCSGTTTQVCDGAGQWRDDAACPFVCSGAGQCTGVCTPGAKRCSGNAPQICDASGQWVANGETCPVECVFGSCVNYPSSCNAASGAGLSTCGEHGNESCCADVLVPGGDFHRGYDGVSSDDRSWPARVSNFRLDKYEVTVARFRVFVEAVSGGFKPPVGSGKHAHLHAGGGLNGGTEPGWAAAWDAFLPAAKATWGTSHYLACAPDAAWTPSPGPNESRPINCVSWYQAQAFCIWDGGFLPSEAEWHYAASGGSEQRFLPWSVPATSTALDLTRASYACFGDGSAPCTVADLLRPGTKPNGRAKWGQLDMSGNASEWVLDLFGSYPAAPCIDCAALSTGSDPRVVRGGSWKDEDVCSLRSAERRSWGAVARNETIGFRCARKP